MSDKAQQSLFGESAALQSKPPPKLAQPDLDTFAKADAFRYLAALPDRSVDLVVTDPPYQSLEIHRSRGTTTRLTADWFTTLPDDELPRLLNEIFRVLKDDRHFYLFCDEYIADVIKTQQGIATSRDRDGGRACKSGFRYWREIIWAKTGREGGRIAPGMGYHYRASCERILFFEKGKRKLNDLGIPDVLLAPRPESKVPAGKPLEVCATLVTQSTEPGEVVCDPFAGSGVVGLAAMNAGRHFLLNDLDDSYLLPEVKARAMPFRGSRFLLIHPRSRDPERFLSQLCAHLNDGERLRPEVAHDLDIFGLVEGPGREVADKLAQTREVERGAILRRHLRGLPWVQAALAQPAEELQGEELKAWLEWIGR